VQVKSDMAETSTRKGLVAFCRLRQKRRRVMDPTVLYLTGHEARLIRVGAPLWDPPSSPGGRECSRPGRQREIAMPPPLQTSSDPLAPPRKAGLPGIESAPVPRRFRRQRQRTLVTSSPTVGGDAMDATVGPSAGRLSSGTCPSPFCEKCLGCSRSVFITFRIISPGV
jgi:hypothetical protein